MLDRGCLCFSTNMIYLNLLYHFHPETSSTSKTNHMITSPYIGCYIKCAQRKKIWDKQRLRVGSMIDRSNNVRYLTWFIFIGVLAFATNSFTLLDQLTHELPYSSIKQMVNLFSTLMREPKKFFE